jgi:hypothetical protein
MSDRIVIAAVLYPICQAVLFGTGVVSVAVLAPTLSQLGLSLARVLLTSLVLAAPLAWAAAPVLASAKERRGWG